MSWSERSRGEHFGIWRVENLRNPLTIGYQYVRRYASAASRPVRTRLHSSPPRPQFADGDDHAGPFWGDVPDFGTRGRHVAGPARL